MKVLGVVMLAIVLSGCDLAKPQAVEHHSTPFTLHSAGSDTFLMNSETGKVWKWSATEQAFLEVPITSKIIKYERGPDGNLRQKPVDPKDPLGLFEKEEEKPK